MRIAITGANGFIGRNLLLHLRERGTDEVLPIVQETSSADRRDRLAQADVVVHLAGVNRPKDEWEFAQGNTEFTEQICADLRAAGRAVPVIF